MQSNFLPLFFKGKEGSTEQQIKQDVLFSQKKNPVGVSAKRKGKEKKRNARTFFLLVRELGEGVFQPPPWIPCARERRASPTFLFAQSPFFRPPKWRSCVGRTTRENLFVPPPSPSSSWFPGKNFILPVLLRETQALLDIRRKEEVFVVEEGPQLRFNFGGSPRSREEERRALDSSPSLAPTPNWQKIGEEERWGERDWKKAKVGAGFDNLLEISCALLREMAF